MSERALATIEEIGALDPIPGADIIEVASVRGWKVVVQKGDYEVGDKIVYFEIDSALPLDDPGFSFLFPKGAREIDGKPYHILKTIRLRGQNSQGLVQPIKNFASIASLGELKVGTDVTVPLGVIKYEKPVSTELGGTHKGDFPTSIVRKTDSERVQNLTDSILQQMSKCAWIATEKIDGSSTTFINEPKGLRVCSRNLELLAPREAIIESFWWTLFDSFGLYWLSRKFNFRGPRSADQLSSQWKIAQELDLANIIPKGWIVQAELYGEGIQQNRLGVKGHHLAIFDVFDSQRESVPMSKWPLELTAYAAPIHTLSFPLSVSEALAQVDGLKSKISPQRLTEGLVWHSVDGVCFPELGNRPTFKAISNKYLLKEK